MNLRLTFDHRDLMNLVRGCSPAYALMEHPLIKPFFRYYDHPQHQEWHGLEKLSEAQLWTMYLVMNPREASK